MASRLVSIRDVGEAMAAAVALVVVALAPSKRAAADIAAGEGKAAECVACHGQAGNSTNLRWPSLAQQPAQFITTALFMFREGNRESDLMSPIAKSLSNADMNDLAAYFAAQKAALPQHRSKPANAIAGPVLAQKLNCSQCHGPQLLGQQHIPRLAGQQYDYLLAQLGGFKAQTRADIDGNMTAAAQALTPQDIEILADYLAGIGAR